jgi:hypothetical protein
MTDGPDPRVLARDRDLAVAINSSLAPLREPGFEDAVVDVLRDWDTLADRLQDGRTLAEISEAEIVAGRVVLVAAHIDQHRDSRDRIVEFTVPEAMDAIRRVAGRWARALEDEL